MDCCLAHWYRARNSGVVSSHCYNDNLYMHFVSVLCISVSCALYYFLFEKFLSLFLSFFYN